MSKFKLAFNAADRGVLYFYGTGFGHATLSREKVRPSDRVAKTEESQRLHFEAALWHPPYPSGARDIEGVRYFYTPEEAHACGREWVGDDKRSSRTYDVQTLPQYVDLTLYEPEDEEGLRKVRLEQRFFTSTAANNYARSWAISGRLPPADE